MVPRHRAIALARKAIRCSSVPGAPVILISSRYTAYGNVSSGPFESPTGKFMYRPHTPVWSIKFKGKFPAPSCGLAGATCPPLRSIDVVINAWTGRTLLLSAPAR